MAHAVTRSTIPGRDRAEQLKWSRPPSLAARSSLHVNRVTVGASPSCIEWLEGPHQKHAYFQKYYFTDTKTEKDGCMGLAIRKRAPVSDPRLTSFCGFTETPKHRLGLLSAGYLWLFALPLSQFTVSTYIDENALQPSQVPSAAPPHTIRTDYVYLVYL